MQNRLSCGLQKLVNDFHGATTLSVDTNNTSVGVLVEKLEHFIVFLLKIC